jgi:hypothetical protein
MRVVILKRELFREVLLSLSKVQSDKLGFIGVVAESSIEMPPG